MTIEETGLIMDLLTASYPQFYKNFTDDEKFKASVVWADMFADDPVQIVAGSVKRLIASDVKGFPPVIGQVKEQIYRLTHPEEMTEQEAWAIVRKSIRHTGAAEKFNELPPVLRRLVGGASQLREWAVMDEETLASVVASNFMRSYRDRAASIREFEKLPSDVKAITQKIADGMRLLELEDGKS